MLFRLDLGTYGCGIKLLIGVHSQDYVFDEDPIKYLYVTQGTGSQCSRRSLDREKG